MEVGRQNRCTVQRLHDTNLPYPPTHPPCLPSSLPRLLHPRPSQEYDAEKLRLLLGRTRDLLLFVAGTLDL